MSNCLQETRRRRGLSAADLASQAGVSRQAIHAIEKGDYVPNTTIALRLAKILATSVEELFPLDEEEGPAGVETQTAELLSGASDLQAGQPLRICQVGRRRVAVPVALPAFELPVADALYLEPSARRAGRAVKVRALERQHMRQDPLARRLLIAGCDPAVSLLSGYLERQSKSTLLAVNASSRRALEILRAGEAHIAGTHLRGRGASTLQVIRQYFTEAEVSVVTFARWEQGFVVARGNPKGISGFGDLARPDLVLVNREPGSGSRTVLDAQLKALRLSGEKVRGYDRLASGHLEAAWKVRAGEADLCLAVGAAAKVMGLDFIPLVTERYDLVIPKGFLSLPAVTSLLELLYRSEFRCQLEAFGGYDTSITGTEVA